MDPALRATCELRGRKRGVVSPGLSAAEAAGRACPVGSSAPDVGVTAGAVQEGASTNTAGVGAAAESQQLRSALPLPAHRVGHFPLSQPGGTEL